MPTLVLALDTNGVDVEVQADIHPSMQMQWHTVNASDQLYQTMKNKLSLDGGWVLLPYGLYVELQTNDISRIISLHVDNLVSTNKKDTISIDSIYISHNGARPVSAKKDLAILDANDRGLLKTHVLLFIIKTNKTHKPGQYLANFKFVSNTLP
jgi:hypothetical protein